MSTTSGIVTIQPKTVMTPTMLRPAPVRAKGRSSPTWLDREFHEAVRRQP